MTEYILTVPNDVNYLFGHSSLVTSKLISSKATLGLVFPSMAPLYRRIMTFSV